MFKCVWCVLVTVYAYIAKTFKYLYMKKIFTSFFMTFILSAIASVAMAAGVRQNSASAAVSKAYGIRVYSNSWGTDIRRSELVSFDVDKPQDIAVEQSFDNKLVRAAAYVDGTYYMIESDDGYVAYRFSAYNTDTKQYRVIKEYKISDLENALMFQCMTYDSKSNRIYAYAFDIRNSSGDGEELEIPFELFTIDPATGAATLVGENSMKQILTLAADANGCLYGMDTEGTLWGVNKTRGTLSGEEGYAPLQPKSMQSMAFDTKNNLLYWAGFTESDGNGKGFFGKFKFSEDEGWMYNDVADLADCSEIIGLWIDSDPLPKGTPAAVGNLTMKAADGGELKATLSWVNPIYNNGGDKLTGTLDVNIYRDGSLLQTVHNQKPGEPGSVVIDEQSSGMKSFTVAAATAEGDGRTAYTEGFVGRDVPGAVGEMKISKTGDKSLSVSWKAPEKGAHGGWFDRQSLAYNLVRLPDNVTVAEGTTSSSFSDDAINTMAGYSYKVTPVNAEGEGSSAESAQEFAGTPLEMPFACDFSTDALVRLWKVYDADADGQTWYAARNSVETFMKYFPDNELSPELTSNDWLISAPMHFEAGKTYSLQYWTRSQGSLFPVNYNVTIGAEPAPESQTTLLRSVRGFDNQSMERQTTTISVAESGTYSIGFQVLNRVQLNIKDIAIEERQPVELSADAISGNSAPVAGEEAVYKVSVSNNGYEPQTGFNIQLVDNDGNVVASSTVTESIYAFASKDINVGWTPAKTGTMKIRARVVANGDADPSNDMTEPLSVTVLGAGQWIDVAKKGMAINGVTPFYLNANYSLNQTIYDADSISCTKAGIKGLMFYYQATADNADVPVKIYLANTSKANFTDKTILPEEDFTLVYDGTVNMPADQSSVVVLFDKTFEYTGGNLALMTAKNNGAMLKGVYFMSQYVRGDRDKHSWYYKDAAPFDFPTNVRLFVNDRASVSLFIAKENDPTGISTVGASGALSVSVDGSMMRVNGDYDSLCIYNVNGQKVAECVHSAVVPMDKCRKGIYVLEFTKGDSRVVKKIVIE